MSEHIPPPQLPEGERQALARTSIPGLCLMVLGMVNLIMGLLLIQQGFMSLRLTDEQWLDQVKAKIDMSEMEKQGFSVKGLHNASTLISLVLGGLNAVGSLVVIYGGWNLRSLNHYGLAVLGSIWAAVPFVSCTACCGPGEVIGIWSLIVLMNRDVRNAFR
jgi:hypothetical protein